MTCSLTRLPAHAPYRESVPGLFPGHVSGCWHQATQSADTWFQWFTRTDKTALIRRVWRESTALFSTALPGPLYTSSQPCSEHGPKMGWCLS